MEDDLNYFENGRQPKFVWKWRALKIKTMVVAPHLLSLINKQEIRK